MLQINNQLTKGNKMNTTKENMISEIKQELSQGEELSDIKDRQGEFVDGYLPVYYDRIIKEWQDMPSDYDNRGANELGMPAEINIYNLMTSDLYVYYSDLFNEAIEEIEEELEPAE
jgi:hypothetical protein